MRELAGRAAELRSRHRAVSPLVLPNVWDIASARAVEEAGFPVVATSSAAMLEVLGHRDDGSAPPDEVFAAIARIAGAVSVPVTADIEDGYGLPPDELADRLLAAGAVGCNLEDSDHRRPGRLLDPDGQAARIAGVVAAGRAQGVDLVVNARVDVYVRSTGDPVGPDDRLDEAVRRATAYSAAGAACAYPILIPEAEIAPFVARCPCAVNVLAPPDRRVVGRLAELGVARISMGGLVARAARQWLAGFLADLGAPASP